MAFEEREMGGATSLGGGAADAVPSGGAASLAPDTGAALSPAPAMSATQGASDALGGTMQTAMDAVRAAIRDAANGSSAVKWGGTGSATGNPAAGGSIAELVKSIMAAQTAQPAQPATPTPAASQQPAPPLRPAQPAAASTPAAQPSAPAFETREFGADDPFGRTGSGMFADVNGETFGFGGDFDPSDTAAAQKAYNDAVAVQGMMDKYYA